MDPAAYLKMAETEEQHWWYVARREILASVIKEMNLPKNSKILEAGCGAGGNLSMLAQFGEVSAFEMNDMARAIAQEKSKGRFHIEAGSCPDHIPFAGQQFDLICLFDVLEHIEQDTETLVAIKKLLNKNARLLITVPAYQWLYSTHDKLLHHYRRYSFAQLKQKILTARFYPEKISYFNTFLFPLAVAARIKDKFCKNMLSTGICLPHKIVNKIFTQVFCAERFLLKYSNLPFGVSLICVLTSANDSSA